MEGLGLSEVQSGVGTSGMFGAVGHRLALNHHEQTEWQLRTLVEGIPLLVWRSCDLGQWTWASPQWLSFTGQTQAMSHGLGWLDVVHPDDRPAAVMAWDQARSHGELDVEFRVRRASDGDYVWHQTRSAPVRDAQGRIVEWLGTTIDVQRLKTLQQKQVALLAALQQQTDDLKTEVQIRKRAEEKLRYTAYHDDLTKLHNRAFFMGQLRAVLSERAGWAGGGSAMLLLDLDRFKQVNDSLGHLAGDTLLANLGRRLQGCVGPEDTVARLGGDEFGLLVRVPDPAALAELVSRVQAVVRQPARFGRREIVSSCSLGTTWVTRRHATPEDVLQEADIALYEVKREQRGGHRAFAEPMRSTASKVHDLRTDLRRAVDRSELELHYQPICDTATRIITGFEALVRWRHPRLGLLLPGEFMPLAEESGLNGAIGHWVRSAGCSQLKRWRERYPDLALTLNVNIGGDEVKEPAFIDDVSAMLASAGLEPECLELEITEGILLEQSVRVLDALSGLRSLGIRVAIDDFGTGYSSLGYLDRYAVDTVKVDKSFVGRMRTESRTRAIIDAIVGLGQTLSTRIVAEGVENEGELDLLRTMRCGFVQGFLLGRPCPVPEATAMLDALARRGRPDD